MKELEHQSLKNLHILGSNMGECARIAVIRLSATGSENYMAQLPNGINTQKFR
jgi:hypothetical protein